MPRLNLYITRTTAIAVAMLATMAVAACSDEQEPAVIPSPPAEHEITADVLIAQLESVNFDFDEPVEITGQGLSQMYGFSRAVNHPASDSNDEVWTYEFVGTAEALMAATRVAPDGLSVDFPVDNEGESREVDLGSGGYGFSTHRTLFVAGQTIAFHYGDTVELSDAIERVMGEPFAGTRVLGKWNTPDSGDYAIKYPKFENIWVEEPMEADGLTVDEIEPITETEALIRLTLSVQQPFSPGCVGPPVRYQVVVGDEIRISWLNRIANEDTLTFMDPCDLNSEWIESDLVIPRVAMGNTYTVLFNEQVLGTVET